MKRLCSLDLVLLLVVTTVVVLAGGGDQEHEMEDSFGNPATSNEEFEGFDVNNMPDDDTVVADIKSEDSYPLESMYEFAPEFCPTRGWKADQNEMIKCIPKERRCRRMVFDDLLTPKEADTIRSMFDSILSHYAKEVEGPAKLVDLNKGIISYMSSFADLHKLVAMQVGSIQKWIKQQRDDEKKIAEENSVEGEDAEKAAKGRRQKYMERAGAAVHKILGPLERIDLYEEIVGRIHKAVTLYYLTDPEKFETEEESDAFYNANKHVLRVAQPTFFSRLEGGKEPKSANDEYWHEHVDTDQYGTFAVTTLLYLNSQMRDPTYDGPESGAKGADALRAGFEGGSFIFGGPYNATVRPKLARFSAFTSSHENPHRVEKVKSGVRFALTSAFTCARVAQISHPISEGSMGELTDVELQAQELPTPFLNTIKGLLMSIQSDGDLGPFFYEEGAKNLADQF